MAVAAASSGTRQQAGHTTVASRARDQAERQPKQIALRQKHHGVWRETAWAEVWDEVQTAAHGLLALGVGVGDRVAIHSLDRAEWVVMDLATVAVRGITVGLYPTSPVAEVAYTLGDCSPRILLAEDQEQVDKALEAGEPGDDLERIIYLEDRGLSGYTDQRLTAWDAFLDLGRTHRAEHPGALAERMAAAEPDDVMTLVYTSGTAGPPRAAMLTNANASFAIDALVTAPERMPGGKVPGPKDQILTYLPLCHAAERVFSTWHLVACGTVLNFAESPEAVYANLREIQPSLFFAVPRVWEKLHAAVVTRVADATPVKKLFLTRGLAAAAWVGQQRAANEGRWTPGARVVHAIGWVLVHRALLTRLGLRHCRYAASGAAPIAPDVLQFFLGLGLDVQEVYGLTESSAVGTANLAGRNRIGTVGEPLPAAADGFRIDGASGEIQLRHDGVFAGYWGRPEESAEALTPDGWLRTGDVGERVDGSHVRIVDRLKDVIITAGGMSISPSSIENMLKTSPYVSEAMVIGNRRKHLAALISIDPDAVGAWCRRFNIPYTGYRDLVTKEEVERLIQEAVDATNDKLASAEGIKAFRLLPKELDHEDGELTATQKLKRAALEDRYRDLVEEMYR